jgi:hypothetical protein
MGASRRLARHAGPEDAAGSFISGRCFATPPLPNTQDVRLAFGLSEVQVEAISAAQAF